MSPILSCREVALAIYGFESGQLVVCKYRLPSELQPWVHRIHIGEVVEPEDDPANWNGRDSERTYCQLAGTVPVHYCRRFSCSDCRSQYPQGFFRYDRAGSLVRITEDDAALPFTGQVLRLIGVTALRNLARANYPGASELLAQQGEESG